MIKINLAPTAKKGKAPKAKAAKAARPGIKLPPIKSSAVYILGVALFLIIVAVLLVIQQSRTAGLNRNIKNLNARLAELEMYVRTVDSLKLRETQLTSLIAPIKELNRNRFLIAHVMDEISQRVPEFTWLTSLDISSSSIGIKGTTASNLLVADFMNRLEESSYIGNVDLTVLEKKTVEKQEMMEFTLTASVTMDTLARRKQ